MSEQETFIYGIQWIDDGGPFDIPTFMDDLLEPLQKMGLKETDIIDDGAVVLHNGETHYVIRTRTPIPTTHWRRDERWSTTNELWLHTFPLEAMSIKQSISIEELDELNQF